MASTRPVRRPKEGNAKQWLAAAGGVAVLLLGCWVVYKKVVKPILGAVDIVQAIQSGEWDLNWTLPEDGNALLLRADSHTNVAAALLQANARVQQERLAIQSLVDGDDTDARFYVAAPYNGVVEVQGFLDWQEAQVAAVAASLSTQFQSQVIMTLMDDLGESGVYAVFDGGEQKFRMRRWYRMTGFTDYKEFVEREGEEWAVAQGFVPDPAELVETDRVSFQDANEFTIKLGIDISDRPFDFTNYLVLRPGIATP